MFLKSFQESFIQYNLVNSKTVNSTYPWTLGDFRVQTLTLINQSYINTVNSNLRITRCKSESFVFYVEDDLAWSRCADRVMTPRLAAKLHAVASLVKQEFGGTGKIIKT